MDITQVYPYDEDEDNWTDCTECGESINIDNYDSYTQVQYPGPSGQLITMGAMCKACSTRKAVEQHIEEKYPALNTDEWIDALLEALEYFRTGKSTHSVRLPNGKLAVVWDIVFGTDIDQFIKVD